MESIDLALFYHSVLSFPKDESDVSLLAEKIRKLLVVPIVAVSIEGVDARAAGTVDFKIIEPELRKLSISQGSETQSFQLRKIKRPAQNSENHGSGIQLLYAAPICAEVKTSPAFRDQHQSQHFGWVLAGSNRPLAHENELLLMALVQHLADLAVVNQAESALALRDQFLSIASHELKTPLTSIYGILQLQERMLKQKKDRGELESEQEKQLSFFKLVIRQVERLNELIDGLLDVSRIQVGRFLVEPSDVDVVSLLHETMSGRLTVIAQEAGVQIQEDTPAKLDAQVDPVRFEEVITNLVMNAIRFSPEGGVVWVKLREEEDMFYLSVRDQGPAIPEVDRNRIFQPFERAQRTSRLGGLGLGLFISRQIAQLHGGTVILAESIPGKGNLFEASFPISSSQQRSA